MNEWFNRNLALFNKLTHMDRDVMWPDYIVKPFDISNDLDIKWISCAPGTMPSQIGKFNFWLNPLKLDNLLLIRVLSVP